MMEYWNDGMVELGVLKIWENSRNSFILEMLIL